MLNIINILVQHRPAEMCLMILENTVQKSLFHVGCLAWVFVTEILWQLTEYWITAQRSW